MRLLGEDAFYDPEEEAGYDLVYGNNDKKIGGWSVYDYSADGSFEVWWFEFYGGFVDPCCGFAWISFDQKGWTAAMDFDALMCTFAEAGVELPEAKASASLVADVFTRGVIELHAHVREIGWRDCPNHDSRAGSCPHCGHEKGHHGPVQLDPLEILAEALLEVA